MVVDAIDTPSLFKYLPTTLEQSLTCSLPSLPTAMKTGQDRKAMAIGIHHSLDGVTNRKSKLLHFLKTKYFMQREEGTSF
jgi:hypothetical protein